MRTQSFTLTVIIVLFVMIFSSCKKEISGCTDKNSTNYNASATKDDGSCQYQGTMVIWWNQEFSDSTQYYGITGINVYVNGVFINQYPTTSYWNVAPGCGSNGAINITENMGHNSSESFIVLLKDQNGNLLTNNTVSLVGNTCVQLFIPW